MYKWVNICFVAVTSVAVLTQLLLPIFRSPLSQLDKGLAEWLVSNQFEYCASYLKNSGKYVTQVYS